MKDYQRIRIAQIEDCPDMLSIYAPFVTNTVVSFEANVPDLHDFVHRFKSITVGYPWLVCEHNRQILGYAYASSYRSRAGYAWSTEVTIYVAEQHHGQGIGRALYTKLFDLLKLQGYRNALATIALPNPSSEKLHTKLGFFKIGIQKNVGYKLSRWIDVVWYQLELTQNDNLTRPKPFAALKESLVSDVFDA